MELPDFPPRPSLDDAFDKLSRAKGHFEVLRGEVEPFEERDTHTISVEVDPDAGHYTFSVHGLEATPESDWGLIAGDCLHNGRSALDYLVVRLFALATMKRPRDIGSIQFPIYDDPKRFNSATAEMRKTPSFNGYLARIEELQPFNRGNASIWGTHPQEHPPIPPMPVFHYLPIALNRLSALNNIDKHRVIHAAWLGINASTARDFAAPMSPPADFEFARSNTTTGPLKNDTEIGSVTFKTPLPSKWQPSDVDMKRNFPLHVAIFDEAGFAEGVLEVLGSCLWAVESVLTIFSPVFADPQEPPLPVTAIPNLDPVPFP